MGWVAAKQEAEGLTDTALAKLLGVRQPHISRLKARKKGYSLKFLERLIGLWPDDCDTIRSLALPCRSDRTEEAA